jgi:hypothetical protein
MAVKHLRSGYNFVERNLLGHKIEDIKETMSIVAFLRLLRRGETPPRQVKVVGLDRLLLRMQDRDSSRFLRRLLSEASDILMQRGPVILFPVVRISWNLHPKLVVDGKGEIVIISRLRARCSPDARRGLRGLENRRPRSAPNCQARR